MSLRGGMFLSTISPCLRASVFPRLLGAPLRGCGLSALATSTSSRLVFKRRRHRKSSPYKNFANFANFAWDLIPNTVCLSPFCLPKLFIIHYSLFILHHSSFPSWVLSKTRSLKTQRYSRSEKICGALGAHLSAITRFASGAPASRSKPFRDGASRFGV